MSHAKEHEDPVKEVLEMLREIGEIPAEEPATNGQVVEELRGIVMYLIDEEDEKYIMQRVAKLA